MLPEDTIETPGDLDPITSLTDNAEFEIKEPSLSVNNKIIKSNLRATMGIDANTAYKDRVKTKVLWTGPLSVVSTPTSLDGAEKFSDWDLIEINFNLVADAATVSNATPYVIRQENLVSIRGYSNTGDMFFTKLSDTSFELTTKSVAAGNIQRIIGISL